MVAVIPARFASSRFPGKPLADIHGKPMIWWVHHAVSEAKGLDAVYVATDDERISEYCENNGIKAVMTSDKHKTHLDRIHEFSEKIKSNFYINVNGDEPLIDPRSIELIIPPQNTDPNEFYAANGMIELKNPIDAIDTSKIKIVTDTLGYGMYMSRTPIPYPKGSSAFTMKKFVGIQCFSKSALNFIHETKRGPIENIEDIDEYRIMENGKNLRFVLVEADTLSIDTKKDLEKVRSIISQRFPELFERVV